MIKILHIEDEFLYRNIVQTIIENKFKIKYKWVETENDLKESLKKKWDIILCGYNVPHLLFQTIIELIKSVIKDPVIIIISNNITEKEIVYWMERGVCDCLLKTNLTRLNSIIARELKRKKKI